MATEEQTNVNTLNNGLSSGTSAGQRLTITSRTLSKLSFYLKRTGSPGGTLTFLIRAVSGDAVLVTKAWGSSNSISTTPAWYEVIFDTPTAINEEVYILALASAGTGGNIISIYGSYPDDVKASEFVVTRTSGGSYTNQTDRDMGYKYTYIAAGVGLFPSDGETRVTSITHRFDRGIYTMELGLGEVVSFSDPFSPETKVKPAILEELDPVITGFEQPGFGQRRLPLGLGTVAGIPGLTNADPVTLRGGGRGRRPVPVRPSEPREAPPRPDLIGERPSEIAARKAADAEKRRLAKERALARAKRAGDDFSRGFT